MPIELRDFIFANLARSTLVEAIDADDTTLTVVVEDGGTFPSADQSLFVDDIFAVVLHGGNSTFEICYCTAISGNLLTVERGREDTVAQAFSAGTTVVHTVTRGFLEQVVAKRQGTAPSAVVLTADELYGTVELDWTASTPFSGDFIRQYDVYRQDNGVGAFVLIATVDGDVLTYTDTAVDLITDFYNYYVVAVAFLGGDSANSNIVEAGNVSFLPMLTASLNAWSGAVGAGAVHLAAAAGCDIEVTCGTVVNRGFLPMPPIYPLPTGKYYFEFKYTQLPNRVNAGIGTEFGFGRTDHFDVDTDVPNPATTLPWYDDYDGTTGGYINDAAGVTTNAAAQLNANDIVGVAVDFDNHKVWFAKNNTWQGPGTQNPATNQGGFWPTVLTNVAVVGATPHAWLGPWLGIDFNVQGSKVQTRFSQEFWTYTPPAGFEEIDYYRREQGMPLSGSAVEDPLAGFNIDNISPGLAVATLLATGGTNNCLRHATARSTGKWYAEFTNIGTSGATSTASFGIARRIDALYNADVGRSIAASGQNIGTLADGGIRSNNTNTATYGATTWMNTIDGRGVASWGNGDTMMIAVDLDNARIYFGCNGVWFNSQDPTNIAHGAPIPGAPASYDLLCNRSDNSILFNTGGLRFSYTMPAGYLPWGHNS